ncbi:Ig-like domain-containing protein [Streptomyces sp. NPDC056672]|uniref:Ig-like domain-containing protein n=1 Tax=Streptomyces sp. NPDC056672 TaxID=3345906 RepID=UPI003686CACB
MTRLARARTFPALLMCCALILGAAAAVLGAAATARAADRLGDLTLSRTSGSINDNPLVPHVTTDAPCPAGQGDALQLRVVHPTTGLRPSLGQLSAGGYDTAPVDVDLPVWGTSFANILDGWFGAESHDGTYTLQLECPNWDDTNAFAFFSTNIEVTGDTWTLPQAEATSVELTAVPEIESALGDTVTITAKVTPAVAGDFTLTAQQLNAEPVELGSKAADNGTAVFTTTALPLGVMSLGAQFTPADPDAYTGSVGSIADYTVKPATGPSGSPSPSGSQSPEEPADLEVVDADGNPLGENPNLEAGQKVAVTARGYAPSAVVKVSLSDSETAFADATADAEGIVQGYDFTVPDEIADGDHTLTLAEDKADGHSVAFAFTTGEVADPDPSPEPSDSTGEDGGTTDGATGGDTGGSDTGGTGGSDGGSGSAGGGSGGGGGSLASTGTGVAAIGLGSLALLFVGAAFVVSARRKGMLTFAAPAGTPVD